MDGIRVGQHQLVSRFLKGVFKSLPENNHLSFQSLTHKVAMLMALTNADRCSDLAALDLCYRSFQGNGVKFIIPGLTKTRKNGPPMEAFYSAFPEDPKLCPVQALQCYEKRSRGLRPIPQDTTKNALFISVRKPHKPVKPATIGHWLKAVMSSAGIDTNVFSAHSTSKAQMVGVSTTDILKAANWSSTSTFCRFYHRPVNSEQFGLGVLRSNNPPTLVSFERYHIVN